MTGASEVRDFIDVLLRDAQPTRQDVAEYGVDIVDARRRDAVGKLLQYRRDDRRVGMVDARADELSVLSPSGDRFLGNPRVEAFLAEQAQKIWLAEDPVQAMSDFIGRQRRGRPPLSDEVILPFIAEVDRLREEGGGQVGKLSRDNAVEKAKDLLGNGDSFDYALRIYKKWGKKKKLEARLIDKPI